MFWNTKNVGYNFLQSKVFQFSNDSRTLLLSNGSDVLEYSVETGNLYQVHNFSDNVNGLVLTEEKKGFVITQQGQLVLWDFQLKRVVQQWKVIDELYSIVIDNRRKNIIYFTGFYKEEYCVIEFNINNEEINTLFNGKRAIRQLYKTSSMEYLITYRAKSLYVYNINNKKLIKYKHNNKIKCLSVHPSENIATTGDSTGKLSYWKLGNDNKENKEEKTIGQLKELIQQQHWHASGVNSIVFSTDGYYLYSGGHESVLVIWQYQNNNTNYLPRLTSSIKSLHLSSDNRFIACLLFDNTIIVVNTATLQITTKIQTIRVTDNTSTTRSISKLTVHPIQSTVALSVSNYIQFYDVVTDKLIQELEVTGLPKIKSNVTTPETVIDNFIITFDGNYLITIEHQLNSDEFTMKFWQWKGTAFEINTRVENIHSYSVSGLCCHPTQYLVITTGGDLTAKIWSTVDVGDGKIPIISWFCRNVIQLKYQEAAVTPSFSPDGSLFIIPSLHVVSFWNTSNLSLIKELPITSNKFNNTIISTHFVPNSPYLIVTTSKTLLVYNLLTLSLHWSYKVSNINLITVDTSNQRFLVNIDKLGDINQSINDIYSFSLLFHVSSCVPLGYWKFPFSIEHGVFYNSKQIKSAQSPANSIFVGVTNNGYKPLLLLEEHAFSSNVNEINHNNSNISTIDFKELRVGAIDVNIEKIESEIVFNTLDNAKQAANLLVGPSHILPPITTLYKSFINSITIKVQNKELINSECIRTKNDQASVTNNSQNEFMEVEKEALQYLSKEQKVQLNYLFNTINTNSKPNALSHKKVLKSKHNGQKNGNKKF